MMTPIILKAWKEELQEKTMNSHALKVSNTALGRLTMMLRESLDENHGNSERAEESFKTRIASIKTDSVRYEGEKLLEKSRKQINELRINDSKPLKELKALGYSEERISSMKRDEWGEFLLGVLTELKYRGGNT